MKKFFPFIILTVIIIAIIVVLVRKKTSPKTGPTAVSTDLVSPDGTVIKVPVPVMPPSCEYSNKFVKGSDNTVYWIGFDSKSGTCKKTHWTNKTKDSVLAWTSAIKVPDLYLTIV